MRRLLILFLMVVVPSAILSGQRTGAVISGRITDQTGAPLPGASVVIDSLHRGVAADNDGKYMLRLQHDGTYHLRVSYVGYQAADTVVSVTGNTLLDLSLHESVYITSEVIVRASRAGVRTPMAHTTVRSEELKAMDMTRDIPFLLSLTPSVVETSESGIGTGNTTLRIRGTDASRINITLDGIPLNDAESQQVFWVNMPDLASSADGIQVQRGVGTSTNGSGAFGASVNISTKAAPVEAGATADFAYGSFNTSRVSASGWTGMLGERFNMIIRGSRISSDGYVEHSASDMNSVMISGAWSSPSDLLRFNVISGNQKTGISWVGVPAEMLDVNRRYNPAGEYIDKRGVTRYYENETDNYRQNHYQLFYTHRFSGRVSLNTGLHMTTGLGYYEEQKSGRKPEEYGIEDLLPAVPPVTSVDLVQRKWLDNIFYGMVWSLIKESEAAEWTLGGVINRYDGDHYGTLEWMEHPGEIYPGYEWYRNSGIKDELSIYGKLNKRLSGSFNGFLDLQLRRIYYRFEGPESDLTAMTGTYPFLFFNPKAGLFWSNGSGSEAFVSVAVAHREPARANYKDAAGDPEATPQRERLTDFEAGYSFSTLHTAIGLNLFYMSYRDQLVPTGRVSNTGRPVMTNVPESFRAGAELSASWRPSSLMQMTINATLNRSRIKEFRNHFFNYNTEDWSEEYIWRDLGSVDIAYSPRLTGSAELEVNPLEQLSLFVTGKYVGRQYFDNTMSPDRAIDPYFVTSLSAAYGFNMKKAGRVMVRFMVNNLFNTLYENNAYGGMWTEDGTEKSWAYYFPQAGINYTAALSLSF